MLPAFALVLALGLASFAGMVNDGIGRGEAAAAWQSTGADAVIKAGPRPGPIGSAVLREIAAVPGVRQATRSGHGLQTSGGQAVTVLAVDPAGDAALTAGTPFPSFPAGRLGRGARPGFRGPCRCSPPRPPPPRSGGRRLQLFSVAPVGPVTVRVAGTLSATPALPGGGAFAVMALRTLPGQDGLRAGHLLVNGSGIDQARLSAVASRAVPGGTITFRSAVLAALAGSPLPHGGAVIITLSIAAAAAFGLFIVLLGLALGAAERELTLARLTVMGHDRDTRLVMAEAMPAVLAAVAAGAVCAVVLPRLVGSSIDLSAFRGHRAGRSRAGRGRARRPRRLRSPPRAPWPPRPGRCAAAASPPLASEAARCYALC